MKNLNLTSLYYLTSLLMGIASLTSCGNDRNIDEEPEQPLTNEMLRYRAPKAESVRDTVTVYSLMPAPGQHLRYIQAKTEEEACRYAEQRMNKEKNYVPLGAWGGYIVVGFDHSVYNASATNDSEYDFSIIGNAFDGSSEPGIVYVMQDENGNGLPDDTWYELRGSETGKETTWQDYEVTYYRPEKGKPVRWEDNRGNSGLVSDKVAAVYPKWIKEDSYRLSGTRLEHRTVLDGIWKNQSYDWGYADNFGNDFLVKGSNPNADPAGTGFKIKNAMHPDGTPAKLLYIDFIKVQTGVLSQAGILGEVSTEVLGFRDLQMEKAPRKL